MWNRFVELKNLTAFNSVIEYCREKLNFANALLKKSDIVKLYNNENNDNNFMFILQHKFCNSKC